ncbi:MAG: putative lipid II flippase FtsW [Clostridiales bacterium]|nr:putative lipid II flippase FtsW [Clostridiales bacterium]
MNQNKKTHPDWWLLLATLCLLAVGLIMVFSSSMYVAAYEFDDILYYLRTQGLAAVLGLCCMFVAYNFSMRFLRLVAWPLALVVLGLLIFMVTSSNVESIAGTLRFLRLGDYGFQPSELCKVALPLILAKQLSDNLPRIREFKTAYMPALIAVGLTSVLIVAQRDFSSGVVVACTGFIMMFCAGIRAGYLVGTLSLGGGLGALAIMMEPYRLLRLSYWLDPWSDELGSGLQMVQSLTALGNGGLTGVGLGAGGSKWYYLPERHNDFIFSVLGEELGFIGALLIVLLFALLLWRGLMIAVHAEDTFASLLALGLVSSLGIQTLMNLGVVTGILPVTGVTLPLISYGGSSLLVSLTAIGLLLNISRLTKNNAADSNKYSVYDIQD